MPAELARHRWTWSLALTAVALLLVAAAPCASASTLRRLASRTVAFASDGVRYVAWQVRAGAAVVVLDTRTGHRGQVRPPAGCQLENEHARGGEGWTAAAGRFLLPCPAGRVDLLDVRTGAVISLPALLGDVFPPYTLGPPSVGARYLENGAPRRYPPSGSELGTEAACQLSSSEKKRRLYCIELFDIATGVVRYLPLDLAAAGSGSGRCTTHLPAASRQDDQEPRRVQRAHLRRWSGS
jgi:hypothetical protein